MRTGRESGFHLPELMIALALGLVLLGAFLTVLQRCRASFVASESLARLQDGARHALSVLVPDIEHAGFYGFTSHALATIAGPLPAGAGDCGSGFAISHHKLYCVSTTEICSGRIAHVWRSAC